VARDKADAIVDAERNVNQLRLMQKSEWGVYCKRVSDGRKERNTRPETVTRVQEKSNWQNSRQNKSHGRRIQVN
jgi:hypothetical protein